MLPCGTDRRGQPARHPEDADWFHELLNLILDRVQGERALHLVLAITGDSKFKPDIGKPG